MDTTNWSAAILMLSSAVLLPTEGGYSQEKSSFAAKGIVEIGGSISFQSLTTVSNGNTSDDAIVTFSRTVFFGYFANDGFELGLNPISWRTITVGDETVTEVSILFAPSYNFRAGGIAFPFLEGLVGFSSLSNGTIRNGLGWGGRAGVKLAIVEHANIVIGLQYLQTTLNTSQDEERNGYNAIEGSIGFSVWL